MASTYIGNRPALPFSLQESTNLLYEDTLTSTDNELIVPDVFEGGRDGCIIEVEFKTAAAASAGTGAGCQINGDTTDANYLYLDHWVNGTTHNTSNGNGTYMGWVNGDAFHYKALIDVSLIPDGTTGDYVVLMKTTLTGSEIGVVASTSQSQNTILYETKITSLTGIRFFLSAASTIEAGSRIRVWGKGASGIILPPSSPQKNILFNSDFSINHRVYAGGALASGSYGYDRWRSGAANSTLNVSGITATIDNTTASTAGVFEQRLEGGSLVDGEYYTLSWEGSAQGSVYRANGSADSYQASPITFIAPSGVDGSSVQEYIKFSGDGATLKKVKLERGRATTPWEKPDQSTELIRCKRYYQTLYIPQFFSMGFGRGTGATTARTEIKELQVPMRSTPTGNTSTSGDIAVHRVSTDLDVSATENVAVIGNDAGSYYFNVTVSIPSSNASYRINTTSTDFTATFDAEL